MANDLIILYRIVRSESPTVDDMRSYMELGIPLVRDDPESLRRAPGISLFDSLQQARETPLQCRGDGDIRDELADGQREIVSMLYELWETKSINLVASYSDRREALAALLDGITRNGPQSVETLALEAEDDDGTITSIAHGEALAELARRELREVRLAG